MTTKVLVLNPALLGQRKGSLCIYAARWAPRLGLRPLAQEGGGFALQEGRSPGAAASSACWDMGRRGRNRSTSAAEAHVLFQWLDFKLPGHHKLWWLPPEGSRSP